MSAPAIADPHALGLPAAPTPSFHALHLSATLLTALTEEGYTTPTPIQAQAIPPVLEGRDVLGCAQTGTGKTAAFALPILHRLMAMPPDTTRRGPAIPRALVLSPTRELASQIEESFATYGRHTGLAHTVIFGGVSQFHQVRALHRGVDILVATPGRLIDLLEQRLVNLSAVGVFVLDEADRMLDMGFIHPIRRIASMLPKERQTLLFSATMPREITRLAESLLSNPVRVAVTPVASAAPLIEQSLYHVPRASKQTLLQHLVRDGQIKRAVVFTKTKHGADKVTRKLTQAGITAVAIHGNKAQNQRERALDAFRGGRSRVLVATDVAARGLDVDGITHVFNYDLPMEPEAYVHRIGRTGRAGAQGLAISFCDAEERGLLRDIERVQGKKIPVTPLPTNLPAEEAGDGPRDDSRHGEPRREYRDDRRPAARPAHGGGSHAARRDARPEHAASEHAASGHAPGHAKPRPRGVYPQRSSFGQGGGRGGR